MVTLIDLYRNPILIIQAPIVSGVDCGWVAPEVRLLTPAASVPPATSPGEKAPEGHETDLEPP